MMPGVDHIIDVFASKGDIGHLALLVWALAASLMAAYVLRAMEAANKRFDSFVRALSRFNERFEHHSTGELHEETIENRKSGGGRIQAGG